MDLDWDDDVLRMEVRRLRRGQIGRKKGNNPGRALRPAQPIHRK